MSLDIDLSTAALLAGVVGLLSSSLVYLTCRPLASSLRDASGLWAFGLYLFGLGMLLIANGQGAPAWVPSVLGNGILAFSFVPLAIAMRRFHGQTETFVLVFGIVLASASVLQHAWLVATRPEVNLRVAIGSFFQAALTIPILSPLVRSKASRRDLGFWLAVGPLVLFALVLLQRAAVFLLGAPMQNAFDLPATQAFSYIIIVLVPVMAASGFSYLCVMRTQEELQRIAATDYLTGCLNRRAFELRGALEIGRARRDRRRLDLMLLDLDHLKEINDRHGHAAGDLLLRRLGVAISSLLGERDDLFRIGGDEFAVLLAGDAGTDPQAFARRLDALLGGDRASQPQSFSVSVGAASLEPDDDLHTLLRRADQAMYAHKAARRRAFRETALAP